MTKTCTTCGETQPETAFYWRERDRASMSQCKVCIRAKSAKWRQVNMTDDRKASWNGYLRDRRAGIKDAVFAAYGGYQCACCGETEKAFLTIDHIANDGASFRREQFPRKSQSHGAGHWTYSWIVRHQFPEGFQVLCMNCNFGKRMNGGICPHSATCNDQARAVGSSDPKWSASGLTRVAG